MFRDSTEATNNFAVYMGALIGAGIAVAFFYLEQRIRSGQDAVERQLDFLTHKTLIEGEGDRRKGRFTFCRGVIGEVLAFVGLLIVLSWISGDVFRFMFGGSDEATNNFSIYVGMVTGALISTLFFWLEQSLTKGQDRLQNRLNLLARIYVVRTCMYNLYDVFMGIDKKIKPDESSRKKYADRLNGYVESFGIGEAMGRNGASGRNVDQEKAIVTILGKARSHEIDPKVDPTKCPSCLELSSEIKDYLDRYRNPFQE